MNSRYLDWGGLKLKEVKIHPSHKTDLLWLYKKSGQGSVFGTIYKMPMGYLGLKVPKDDDGSTIPPGYEAKVNRRSRLYVVVVLPFQSLGWGIGSLPCVTSNGETATVGVNGSFNFSVEFPQMLYESTSSLGDVVSLESFREKILPLINSEIIGSFSQSVVKQLNAVSKELQSCEGNIATVFKSFGLKLESFTVDGIV